MQGFRDGADDYVTKPFSLRELAARVHAMSRRAKRVRTLPASVRFGAVTINPLARTARIGDRDAGLRPKEFDLLLMLVSHPGEALSRAQLLSDVWAYEAGVESRTVDWHVAELRRKLQDEAEAPHLIETVRRGGYRWVGGVGAEEVQC
jgi:DNA-binding response OmpR family regulator